MKQIFFIIFCLFTSNLMAKDYYLILPTVASADYSQQVMASVKELLNRLGSDDHIFVINSESKQQCSLSLTSQSVGNFMRLIRACKGLAIPPGEMNSSSVPQVTTNLLHAYHIKEGSQVLLFLDPLQTTRDELKLAKSSPSLAYLDKLGYGISHFSTYRAVNKTEGSAVLHIIYPNKTSFFNLKHQLTLQNFYGCWAAKLGFRLGSFNSINEGMNRVLDNTLIETDTCESDGTETALFMKDFSKQNDDLAHEKRGFIEVLYKSNSLEQTQPKYQFTLKKPAYLSELTLSEFDGDGDGSNVILLDGVTNDDQIIHLAKLLPSGNNQSKNHVVKIKATKPIRDVIILPVNNEGVPDYLGGVWKVKLLTVTHK